MNGECYSRILLDYECQVDITDKRGQTPLHMASRSGIEENVLLLLNVGADPNKAGDNGITPLHRVNNFGVVKTLIHHGADECRSFTLRSGKLEDGSNITRTAFEMFVDLQPTAAKFCLDENISTNEYDLTSSDLAIILDLSVIMTSTKTEKYRELTLHQKLLRSNLTALLEHPLSETFLVLKHQLLIGYANLNVFFYFLFVVSLTAMSTISTHIWTCCGVGINASSELQLARFIANEEKVEGYRHDYEAKHNLSSVLECLPPRQDCLNWNIEYKCLFWILYVTVWSLSGCIFFRELIQAFSNWRRYVCDRENWLEILMLALIFGYLSTLLSNPEISPHLAALSVLFAWADFALLIGTFPNIGIYIYMSIHIMRKITTILLSFTPAILGFAFAFHTLIPNSDTFDNIIIATLKALVMMSGEFEFENNFRYESVKEVGGSNITTQVIFVLFLFVVSIVVHNLLIGLTVNETEIVFERALAMRLERTFTQILVVEDLLHTSIAKWFRDVFKRKKSTNLKDYLESAQEDLGRLQDPNYKVLIKPNKVEKGGRWLKTLDLIGTTFLFQGVNHPVYLYDEDEESNSVERRPTKLELPDSIVKRIFTILRDREQSKELLPAQARSLESPDVIATLSDKISNLEAQVKQMQEKESLRALRVSAPRKGKDK